MLTEPEYKTLADLGVKGGNPDAVVALCDQNSQEWFGLRCGILTASNAAYCVTSTGELATGQTRQSYINGLIAERLTGSIEMDHQTAAMERGKNLEGPARDWYAFETGREVVQVGFVYRDAGRRSGGSPDGLCADRGVEIKCLMRRGHIGVLLSDKAPTGYLAQVNMLLWVTGLPAWDLCFFTPEPDIPNRTWTVWRDEAVMDVLDEAVPAFMDEVNDGIERIKALEAPQTGGYAE